MTRHSAKSLVNRTRNQAARAQRTLSSLDSFLKTAVEWGADLHKLKENSWGSDERGYLPAIADQFADVLDEWYAAATARVDAGVEREQAMKEVDETLDVLLPLIGNASRNWEDAARAAGRVDAVTGERGLAYVRINTDNSHVVWVDYVRLTAWAEATPASLDAAAGALGHLFETCEDVARRARPLRSAYHAARNATERLDKAINAWIETGDRLVEAQAALVELAAQPISSLPPEAGEGPQPQSATRPLPGPGPAATPERAPEPPETR